jgi:hypothetical protein
VSTMEKRRPSSIEKHAMVAVNSFARIKRSQSSAYWEAKYPSFAVIEIQMTK